MRATITVTPEGINAGFAGSNDAPTERGDIMGWSAGSARRNMDFLKSVYIPDLDGVALAITLTVKDIPETHTEWAYLQKQLLKFLRRCSMIRAHWVTEWTKRNVPHLHMTVFFDPDYIEETPDIAIKIMHYWLKITRHLGTLDRGQHFAVMNPDSGWFQYVSKHASRGHAHYQREKANLPKAWEKTGRLWGRTQGDTWPTVSEKLLIDSKTFWRLRRKIKNWLLAIARKELLDAQENLANSRNKRTQKRLLKVVKAKLRRIVYLRQSLKRNDRNKSEVRGINEWVPFDVVEGFISELAELDGAEITTKEEVQAKADEELPDYWENRKYHESHEETWATPEQPTMVLAYIEYYNLRTVSTVKGASFKGKQWENSGNNRSYKIYSNMAEFEAAAGIDYREELGMEDCETGYEYQQSTKQG